MTNRNETPRKPVPSKAAAARKGPKLGRSQREARIGVTDEAETKERQPNISEYLKQINMEDDAMERAMDIDERERKKKYEAEMEAKRLQAKEIARQRREKYGQKRVDTSPEANGSGDSNKENRSSDETLKNGKRTVPEAMIEETLRQTEEHEPVTDITPIKNNKGEESKEPTSDENSKRVLFKDTRETIPSTQVLYMDLNFTVEKAINGVEEMRRNLVEIMGKLVVMDETMRICKFVEGRRTLEKDALSEPSEVPNTISQIQKYFRDCNPRNDGGRIYTAVCLGFEGEETNLLYNIRNTTKGTNVYLQKRALQKPFAETAGWLMFGHNDMDIPEWQEWMNGQIKKELMLLRTNGKTAHKGEVVIGLKQKYLWDGSNKAERMKNGKKGVRAIHVEVERGVEKLAARLISRVLKLDSFRRRCKLKVRFVSTLTAQIRGSQLGEKIKKCQFKHGQMIFSLSRAYTWELGPNIDESNSETGGKTLRDIIMEMKTREGDNNLFVGIDKKWGFDDGWTLTFGKKVQDEAREMITNMGPYLMHKWGAKAMQGWLTPAAIERASECMWDPEKERIITEDEVMVDEALEDKSDDHWLFDLPKNMEEERGQKITFLPSLPSGDSVSTFNKTVGRSKKKSRFAPGFNPPSHRVEQETNDGLSTMSSLSGRVSHMEKEVNSINSKLDKLLQVVTDATTDRPRPTQAQGHVTPTAGDLSLADGVQ